jgi:hypothetical protein
MKESKRIRASKSAAAKPVVIAPSSPSASSPALPNSFLRCKISSFVEGLSKPDPAWGASLLRQFLLFSALFIGLSLLFWFLSPALLPKPSWSYSIQEAPLVKNTPLQLRPGDYLIYSAQSAEQAHPVRLDLSPKPGCRGVFMVDSSARAMAAEGLGASAAAIPLSSYSVCLGMDGNERGANSTALGSNVSFSNLSWPYFQPWMLALRENWSWSINTSLRIQPYNLSYPHAFNYRVLERTNLSGREAFLVEVTSPASPSNSASLPNPSLGFGPDSDGPFRLWVDVEKRVLLRGEFGNNSLALMEASFLTPPAADSP